MFSGAWAGCRKTFPEPPQSRRALKPCMFMPRAALFSSLSLSVQDVAQQTKREQELQAKYRETVFKVEEARLGR